MTVDAQQQPLTSAPITTSPRVEFRHGLVYKHAQPQALELEALRTRLAGALGEKSGRFSVPQLRLLDLPGQTLATAYIPQLLNLHQVASAHQACPQEVFRAAGRALATVHQQLHLPAGQIVPLPDYLQGEPEDEVALHGDFCCNNVCYQPDPGRIVLLDWSAAPLLGTLATYGSRYFDLLWFAWSLFFWPPRRGLLHWRPEPLMRALALGYAELESRFCWQRYVQYRAVMRPLARQYWHGKRALVRSDLFDTAAQLLGWLRWRWFPRPGPRPLPAPAPSHSCNNQQTKLQRRDA